MKRFILSLSTLLICGALFSVNAQICDPDQSMTEPGLEPTPDSLDCFVQGEYTERTILFKNYDSVDVGGKQNVVWIQIDNIYNLPCGIKWTTNKRNSSDPHRFQSLEAGCIKLAGTTNDPAGQYKLGLNVTANIGGSEISGLDASAVGLRYDVRVKASTGDVCMPVDTTIEGDTASCQETEWTGIKESKISEVTSFEVSPNPFTYSTQLSIYTEKEGTYQLKVHNLLGETVRDQEVTLNYGQNQVDLKQKDLSAGAYILNLSKGDAQLTKKLIVGSNRQ